MRNVITLLSLVYITLLSCRDSGEVASTKFITLEGVGQELYQKYLIQDVKEASWLIHYGFSDNNRCSSSGVTDLDKFERQIKQSVRTTLELWLEPLRGLDAGIVDDFTLTLVDTAQDQRRIEMYPERKPLKLVESNATPHATYIFYCKDSNEPSLLSFALPQVKEVHMRFDFDTNRSSKRHTLNKLSDEGMYMITSLLHETGHIFGLADTYISGLKKEDLSDDIVIDTGDSEVTLGKQPLTIMGFADLLGVHPENGAFITADDAEGVRWLYRLAHDNASIDACPEDYEIEPETKGCVPRHPFIFAVRNRDGGQVSRLLQDSNLDINACDQYGRTALFYAEQYRLRHGGDRGVEDMLINQGADPDKQCPTTTALTSSSEETSAEAQSSAAAAGKTSCGTIKHSSVPEHILLLLLALLALLPPVLRH